MARFQPMVGPPIKGKTGNVNSSSRHALSDTEKPGKHQSNVTGNIWQGGLFGRGMGLFGSGYFVEYDHAKQVFSQNTNVHPAFGAEPKIQRNRRLVQSVYHQTQGYALVRNRTNETMSDPLHRHPDYILQKFREETSVSYRSRGTIRPAAPGLVTWKNQFWTMQRPPALPVIGPFTQGQLEQQSILSRINAFLAGGAK
jgi:hypothetical protein